MLWEGFLVEVMPKPNLEYSRIVGVSQHRSKEGKGIPAKGMKGYMKWEEITSGLLWLELQEQGQE